MGVGNVGLDEVLGIGVYRRYKEPSLTTICKAIEIFFQGGIATVRNPVLTQVSGTHMRGGHIQITPKSGLVIDLPISPVTLGASGKVVLVLRPALAHRSAAADTLHDGFAIPPASPRVSFPPRRRVSRPGPAEMQQPSLGPRIRIDSQRI